MSETKREDWILILDIFTGITHLARPDAKQKDRYVTLCNLTAETGKRSHFMVVTSQPDEDEASAEPTCEPCLIRSDSLLSDKQLDRIFDGMLKDTRGKKS